MIDLVDVLGRDGRTLDGGANGDAPETCGGSG